MKGNRLIEKLPYLGGTGNRTCRLYVAVLGVLLCLYGPANGAGGSATASSVYRVQGDRQELQ